MLKEEAVYERELIVGLKMVQPEVHRTKKNGGKQLRAGFACHTAQQQC